METHTHTSSFSLQVTKISFLYAIEFGHTCRDRILIEIL